jgi:hypothetical protein
MMSFKFHNERGEEVRVTDPSAFKALVDAGHIKADTLLFDEQTSLWKRAAEYDAYQEIIKLQVNPYTDAPSYGAPLTFAPPPQAPMFGASAYDPEPDRGWLIVVSAVLLLIGAALTIYSMANFSASAYEAGYRLGQMIAATVFAAIISLVIWLVPRKKSIQAGLCIFAVGFLCASLLTSANAWREYRSDQAVVENMASMLTDLLKNQNLKPQDISEKKYGKNAPIMKVCYEYFQAVQSDFMNMTQQFQEMGVETLLQKETLQDVAHIEAGQKRIQALLELVDKTEALQRQRADEVISKINSADLPERSKRDFLSGFNATKEQGLAQLGEFFTIEREIFAKIDEMLNFVRSTKGRYSFVGENLIFKSTRDVETYNRLFEEVSLLAQRETDWQQRALRRSQEGIDKLQKR